MHEREAMRWLQLTYKVPSEPSQKRVWVWRRLQNLGAFALQNSVYLLPFSDEVEKNYRQLVFDIREMGGDASIFAVVALDSADEQRILQVLIKAREDEYDVAINVCKRFFHRARIISMEQKWSDELHAELAEILERVHVLFRSAKRHDLLAILTAVQRASAAEALAVCEQIFRLLLDQEYARVRRTLELYTELLASSDEAETAESDPSLVTTSSQKRNGGEDARSS